MMQEKKTPTPQPPVRNKVEAKAGQGKRKRVTYKKGLYQKPFRDHEGLKDLFTQLEFAPRGQEHKKK